MIHPVTKEAIVAAVWLVAMVAVFFLTSCASEQPDTIYVPTEVKVPVAVPCKAKSIQHPQDLLALLPKTTTLTQGVKSCLAQHELDLGYEAQLEASIAACQ